MLELAADADHRVDAVLPACRRRRRGCGVLRRHAHRLVDHAGHADRLEDDERPRAVDRAATPRWLASRAGRRPRRRPSRSASCTAFRREVGGDDRTDALQPELGDARPGRPGRSPSTMAASPLAMPALGDGVDADGERLGQRGDLGGSPAGTLMRDAARSAPSARRSRRGSGWRSRRACSRSASKATGSDTTMSPTFRLSQPGAELDDLAAELVAHHASRGRLEHHRRERIGRRPSSSSSRDSQLLLAVPQQVQVAAADAARQHLGQHLARPRYRIGDLVDPELSSRASRRLACAAPYQACGAARGRSPETRRMASTIERRNAASASIVVEHVAVGGRALEQVAASSMTVMPRVRSPAGLDHHVRRRRVEQLGWVSASTAHGSCTGAPTRLS